MLAFLIIGGVGVVLLLVSVVVGDLLDGAFDGLGPGDWLSGGAIAGFLGAFGFGGALALGASGRIGIAVGVGLLVGALVAVGVGWLTLRLQRGGGDATVRGSALLGLSGTVVSDIPADGYGVVTVVVAGQPTQLNARCPEPLPAGHGVTVDAVLSPTAVAVVPRLL